MKRISIFITVFLLFTLKAESQIKVEASETVELMSVLSRTAGFREYCMDMAGQYSKDTEIWFAPYKEHPSSPITKGFAKIIALDTMPL